MSKLDPAAIERLERHYAKCLHRMMGRDCDECSRFVPALLASHRQLQERVAALERWVHEHPAYVYNYSEADGWQPRCGCGWVGDWVRGHAAAEVELIQHTDAALVAAGGSWKCACGWRGEPEQMTANPSGYRCCPSCGASGGLALAEARDIGLLDAAGGAGESE